MPETTTPLSPTDAGEATAFRTAMEVRAVTSRLRRRIMAVPGGDDLTPPQASVLMRIARGEAATASALATAEKVSPQSIAVTLAALEKGGYIVRTPDPRDGRRQLIEVTEAGTGSVHGALDAGRAWLETELEDRLTAAERERVVEAMQLLQRLLES